MSCHHLTFDRARHEYRLDGQIVPGITSILRAAGLTRSAEFCPESAAARGSAIHAWAEAVLRGRAQAADAPPVVRPYLDGLAAFLRDTGARVVAVEDLVAHTEYRFATMIDLVLDWQGRRWVINTKTGGKFPFYAAQNALESLAWQSWHGAQVAPRRACLYVSREGRYQLDEHTDPHDLTEARALALRSRAQLERETHHDTPHADHPRPRTRPARAAAR